MPGIVQDGVCEHGGMNERTDGVSSKEKLCIDDSSLGGLTTQCRNNEDRGETAKGQADASIDQLYEQVCEMKSSDHSPSRHSFQTESGESGIDSELHHLVAGKMKEVEIMEEDEEIQDPEYGDSFSDSSSKKESSSIDGMQINIPAAGASTSSPSKEASHEEMESEIKSKSPAKPPAGRQAEINAKALSVGVSSMEYGNLPLKSLKLQNGSKDVPDSAICNPDHGRILLNQARDLMSLGDNTHKALELATRAANSFEKCANGKPSLDLVMCLQVIAALHCRLGRYGDAIPVLENAIEIPVAEEGKDHALAKFAGCMQLGDTYAMLGLFEKSISCYTNGLDFQRQVLENNDPRIGETCRYLAEAHMQAMQLDEAQKLCQMALDMHEENGSPASLEEVADRRLMGMICESKGDHEAALEHLVLASMAMVANGQEKEVASVDCSIGDAYLSLNRYDEAISAYQKALALLKSSKGENHPAVASVFVRLADLYNKTGKLRDSKSYCENALHIYEKPIPGITPEEIAGGLTDISRIYESMDELEHALKLLHKALKIYTDSPGQQNMVAAIEAQMGIIYYMLGNYSGSYTSLKSATAKFRVSGENKSAFFGIALNQMGLTCVQLCDINEALQVFEESRSILEQEYGPYHPDTLGVYSNLAGAYDAVGRVDKAIELLELIIGMREEKLGTANPDVEDEKKRLAELLKESGRVRNRKNMSLENLLGSDNQAPTNQTVTT